MKSIQLLKHVTVFGLLLAIASTAMAQVKVDTRIGKLGFTHDWKNGYPTDETVAKLYDEMDFQRATQAYIWAIPFVSQAQMRHMYLDIFEASTGSIVILDTFKRRHGYLTANNDTFYATAWADMGADGPVVVEIPDGINARGAAHDMWWVEIGAMTKPGKYLFVPPGTRANCRRLVTRSTSRMQPMKTASATRS
jgi:hypothetical protein